MQRKTLFAAGAVLIAAALFLVYMMGDTSAPQQTAGTMAGADDTWAKNIGFQMAESLESDNSVIRANALYQTMYFAQHRKDADLAPAVPALLAIYRSDADDQFRIAAAVAIRAIGDSGAMQQVRGALTSQTSPRVQAVSIALLHDFYGSETFENSPEEAQMAKTILAELHEASAPMSVASR